MLTSVRDWDKKRVAGAVIALGVLCVLGLVLSGVFGSSATTTDASLSSSALADAPTRIHGVSYDRLDDPNEPSLTLDSAIAQAGLQPMLPDAGLVGEPVKVVLNETVEDSSGAGRTGLMVLYDSGLKLIIEPGAVDLDALSKSFEGCLPYRDGRSQPYEMRMVAGQPMLVGEPGVQYQGAAETPTEASVIWNVDDANYWLRAPLQSSADSANTGGNGVGIGVDALIQMAQTTMHSNSNGN